MRVRVIIGKEKDEVIRVMMEMNLHLPMEMMVTVMMIGVVLVIR